MLFRDWRTPVTRFLGASAWSGCAVWAVLAYDDRSLAVLTLVMAAGAFVSNIVDAPGDGPFTWSGSFLAAIVAAAFGGPAAAFIVASVAELVAWTFERYRSTALLINLTASCVPIMVGAALVPDHHAGFKFYASLTGIACFVVLANHVLVVGLRSLWDGERLRNRLVHIAPLLPSFVINVALTVAAVALYVRAGLAALVFAFFAIFAFAYMAQLVAQARQRAKEYAALSWGVLSGLVRTLDVRDPRASRHSAAVAAYARDIARAAGMNDHDVELAHTAGLLHDIGRFALSDRVMERGRPLTNEDWTAIRRHPELGAEMLADLGVYGPVAEIVHCHHERIDGRGYPRRLKAEDIPQIAKIIAVAEVYDTLTADDTYRTPISSFEALTELRRVAGSQLDASYVETLSEVLAGRGVEYRHARGASFEQELDLERRIGEAASS